MPRTFSLPPYLGHAGDTLVVSPSEQDVRWAPTGAGSAGKVFVDGNDTTADFLASKLLAGTGITLTIGNAFGNETLTIKSALTVGAPVVGGGNNRVLYEGPTGLLAALSTFTFISPNLSIPNTGEYRISGQRLITANTARSNLSIGFQTGPVTAGTSAGNIYIGQRAGINSTASAFDNTFVGVDSGHDNTSGNDNAFFGLNAGYSNTTGVHNTFIGFIAAAFALSGSFNVCVGDGAGLQVGVTSNNVLIGSNAGSSVGAGGIPGSDGNVCIGANTAGILVDTPNNVIIGNATAGNGNGGVLGGVTIVGAVAGQFNNVEYSTFIGFESGYFNTTGASNTALGAFSGLLNVTANFNTYLGDHADTSGQLDNSTALGYNAIISMANQIVFGQTATPQNNWKVAGIDWVMPALQGGANTVLTNDGAGNLTWTSFSGSGLAWTVVTIDTAMAVNNGYIEASAGIALNMTLPAVSAVGDIIELTADDALGWILVQGAGQTVHFGNQDTTTGATGSLASTDIGDTVRVVCTIANLDWRVLSSIGNLTVN
jgi:hypothetical protein